VWIGITTTYRVALALAGASIGVLQVLVSTKVVTWSPWVVVSIASALGAIAFVDNTRLVYHKFRMHERELARSRMHKPLIGALNAVATARGIPLQCLGISVFAVRSRLGVKGYVIPWEKRRLKRVFRFRLSDWPPRSAVNWSEGKGTIGECWGTGVKAFHDRREVAARFGGRPPTESEFGVMSAAERSGFTRAEFVQTINKYGEILAVPIAKDHSGQIVGVLSIDCLATAYADGVTTILGGADIEEIAGGAAFTVSADVPRF
jgi:hypothetical protein